jgi:hypothetical protein
LPSGRSVRFRPPEVAVAKELEEVLGDDARLLKRAKTRLAQGYGLGACAYLRRVLEDRVDELLVLVRELRASENAPAKDLEELDKIRRGKNADEKLRLVARFAPPAILVEGGNPLLTLHDFLSAGVHRLTEEEAAARAELVMFSLEFMVLELSRAVRAREGYAQSIRAAERLRPAAKKEATKPGRRRGGEA